MAVWTPTLQQFAEPDTLFRPNLVDQITINGEGGFFNGSDLPQATLAANFDFGPGKFTPAVRPRASAGASNLFYPIDGLLAGDEFTLEYWQKLDINWSSHNSGKALFALQGSIGGNYLQLFNIFGGTATSFAGTASNIPARAWSGSWALSVASLGLVDLAWNNFAVTLKTGTLTFYVNGVSKGTITGVNYLPQWSDTTKEEGVLIGGDPGNTNNIWTSDIRISHTARVPAVDTPLRSLTGAMAVNATSTSGSVPVSFSGSLHPGRADYHTTPETMESAVTVQEGIDVLETVRTNGWTVATPMKAGGVDAGHPTLGASGSFSYDWQVVDRTLDWYQARGIETYVGVDPSPILLGGNPGFTPEQYIHLYLGWGGDAEYPNNVTSFSTLQKDLVAHAAARGVPVKALSSWNEPDLSGAATMTQAVDLWAAWALAVRAADASVKLGAGELGNVQSTTWINAIMAKRAASSVPMDFFSVHDYSGSLTAIDQATGHVARYAAANGVSTPPVVFGEYNWADTNDESGVQRFRGGFWHLRSLNAAYMTAFHIHALDVGNVDRLVWAHTGSSYGPVRSGAKYSTMILEDYDDKHFAAFNAMKGWKLAAKGGRSLLTATKSLPPGVYGTATKDPAATRYGLAFANWGWANRNSRTVNVTISNLPAGNYTLKRYLVDETHSSRWDVASDDPVGAPHDALAVVEDRTDTAANLANLTFTLPRWSSTFVTIEPGGTPGQVALTGTSTGSSTMAANMTGGSVTGGTDLYRQALMDTVGLTNYWRLGETSGTVAVNEK